MPAVQVIHRKQPETRLLLDACHNAGFRAEYIPGDGRSTCRAISTEPPGLVLIDLSRLPSHSREVPVWLHSSGGARHVPIVWRKGSAGAELMQNALRDAANAVGVVDYKICAVNGRWSAMLLARAKS
jgi:hypothetical protein